ncbi:hypothetical protein COCON_G00134880 [Conger conger]|uniref:Uncharacterized protein n=1 Tax=Conger conger TaxID=82655 RepID=A0A9Q1HXI4_CONCO|nr:hypothetical protein COCON_G00134880 [Conger conger]
MLSSLTINLVCASLKTGRLDILESFKVTHVPGENTSLRGYISCTFVKRWWSDDTSYVDWPCEFTHATAVPSGQTDSHALARTVPTAAVCTADCRDENKVCP